MEGEVVSTTPRMLASYSTAACACTCAASSAMPWVEHATAAGEPYWEHKPVIPEGTGADELAWEQHYEEGTNKAYYHNTTTGETSWEPPRYCNYTTSERPAQLVSLDADQLTWQQHFDASSGDYYYHNTATDETSWDTPAFYKAAAAAVEPTTPLLKS